MPNAKNKLLIVDDEPATRYLLSQIFIGQGHDVACAEDGFAALEQMRESMPDIILSDLNMPGMSGFEFLSVVRRRVPGIYVIATSGAYTGSGIPDGIAADAFYEKASGLPSLFKIMRTAKESEPVQSRSANAPVPIWISLDKRRAIGYPYFAIACPECLRIFAHARADAIGKVHEETCVYCGSAIQYAIVTVLEAVSEHAYHAELGAQIPAGVGAGRAD
jgi:CheY-like chemotaxis protein